MVGIGGQGRRFRLTRRVPVVLAAALCLLLVLAQPGTAQTPGDTASTNAFLQAEYTLYSTALEQSAASQASLHAFATQLGSECHGVLSGEPDESPVAPFREDARARGERKRSELQEQDIQSELAISAAAALTTPTRPTTAAFLARVEGLSWSDPQVQAKMHALIALDRTGRPVPPVCADMKFWSQSGYHRLSQASKTFEAAEEARGNLLRQAGGSFTTVLRPTEGPAEKALAQRLQALMIRYGEGIDYSRTQSELARALGEKLFPGEQAELEPVIARGRTAAGQTYVVRAERHWPGHCRAAVSVEFQDKRQKNGLRGSSSRSGGCLSGRPLNGLSYGCGSVESFEEPVAPRVRSVRLLLSSGRTITTRVVRVPRRYGGPAAIYVQSVRARQTPVSLTELDGHGRVVRVVKVKPCPAHRGGAPSPPHFVPLADATTPQGERFTIEASIFHPEPHRTQFDLALWLPDVDGDESSAEITLGGKHEKPRPYRWQEAYECAPKPFSVIYGILASPGDSVIAVTTAGPVTMTKVPLVPVLHSGGPLVYGVFTQTPRELIIRRADGSVLYTESLAAKGREDTEFCEGFAEP